jgi:hypothetical protein
MVVVSRRLPDDWQSRDACHSLLRETFAKKPRIMELTT